MIDQQKKKKKAMYSSKDFNLKLNNSQTKAQKLYMSLFSCGISSIINSGASQFQAQFKYLLSVTRDRFC